MHRGGPLVLSGGRCRWNVALYSAAGSCLVACRRLAVSCPLGVAALPEGGDGRTDRGV